MSTHVDHRARDAAERIRVAELPNDHLLTSSELATWLCVSEHSVRRWHQTGTGPRAIQAGLRAIRFKKADVLAWLDQRAVAHAGG